MVCGASIPHICIVILCYFNTTIMKNMNRVMAHLKRMTLKHAFVHVFMMFLSMCLVVSTSQAQNPCGDSTSVQDFAWLDALIGAPGEDCSTSCLTNVAMYCDGTDLVFATGENNNCPDFPATYFDDAGNIICQNGTIAGSDCDQAFIASLNYIGDYWSCTPPNACGGFVADITVDGSGTCLGDTVLLTAIVSGGFPPYSYLWSNGSTSQSISFELDNPNTALTLTTSDSAGCTYTVSQIFDFEDCESDTTICPGCPTVFDPVCVTSATGEVLTFENFCLAMCAGFQQIDLTDCNDSTNTNCNNFFATYTIDNDAYCPGDSITLTATVTGGTAPYSYIWGNSHSGGATTTIVAAPNDIILLIASDANGCVYTLTAELTFENCQTDTTDCNNCPAVFDPVCIETSTGNVITYENFCFAQCAGFEQSDLVECETDIYRL